MRIRRAAVLGAGVMGAQIAALLSAAGVRTYLFDLPSDAPPADPKLAKAVDKNFRSTRSVLAIEQLKELKPSPILSELTLAGIIPVNFEDDISVIRDVDWVIEAVVERLDIKQPLLKKLSEYHRPGTPITTNTSGISLGKLCEGLPESFTSCFFGTHFFNPPRYMKLLEIIPHDGTDPALMADLAEWIEHRLGKGLVEAKDTINFIGNRIGVFTIQSTFQHTDELKLNFETVDALTGTIMGRPSSATYRTVDVVGLDTYAHVARNVYDLVPNDPYRNAFKAPQWMAGLIEKGHVGQKSDSTGCYKKIKNKGETEILAYRPESGTYEPQNVQDFAWMKDVKRLDLVKRLQTILGQNDAGAQLIWRVLRDTFAYSALLVKDIANGKPMAVDEAIRWGFNWEMGPFELWQALGYEKILQRMQAEGIKLPSDFDKVTFYKPAPGTDEWELTGPSSQWNFLDKSFRAVEKSQHHIKLPTSGTSKDPRVVLKNEFASLVDIGDGVAALSFHSKMNTLDLQLLDLVQKALVVTNDQFAAMVIANDGPHFSAGANLQVILQAIMKKDFASIDQTLRHFQATMQLIKYSSFPVIACPFNLTLGGGCEVSLHAHRQLVHIETYAGLVEVGVGLIPGAGGTKELALRAYRTAGLGDTYKPMPFLQRAFMLIGMGKTSTSGANAIEMSLYDYATSTVTFTKDRQTSQAKFMAIEMLQRGFSPAMPVQSVAVVGDPGIQTFKMMLYNMVQGRQISEYDAFIGERVATVLCGGEVDRGTKLSEQQFLDLERRVFVELCQQEKTAARIEHMLKTGKPLRN